MDKEKVQVNVIADKKDADEFRIIQKEYKRAGKLANVLFHDMLTDFVEKKKLH